MEKFPLGSIQWKSIRIMDVTMYDLYLPLFKNPNSEAVIKVENITGPVLRISSKMDNMWSSEPAAQQIMNIISSFLTTKKTINTPIRPTVDR